MNLHILVGVGAAVAAALLGSGWQLLTRHGVTTALGPVEIALLRYGIPALLLSPVLWRVGLRPSRLSWGRLAAMVAGGGLPFGLLVFAGAQHAPAAHMGIFMAGAMPVFTAIACRALLSESITPRRWLGFAIIAAGAIGLALPQLAAASAALRGDVLFLLAAAAWAGYTVAFRGSGLTPLAAAAIVNAWSLAALLLLLPFTGAPRLFTAPPGELALQAIGQGVLAGWLGLVAYMVAVARLGSANAALSAAGVPLLTTLGAVAVLGEPAGPGILAAAGAVAVGIALASGVPLRRAKAIAPPQAAAPPTRAES